MEAEQEKLVKDLMRAIADNKPRDVLLKLARQAKVGLSAVWTECSQAISMVDTMQAQ